MSEREFDEATWTKLKREVRRGHILEDRLSAIILECRAELERIEKHGDETGFAERVLAIARGN